MMKKIYEAISNQRRLNYEKDYVKQKYDWLAEYYDATVDKNHLPLRKFSEKDDVYWNSGVDHD